MNLQYASALIVSSIISFYLSVVAWRRRPAPGASGLAVIMFALFFWSLTYAFRWMTNSTDAELIWLKLTYFSVVLAPSAMLVFAFQFVQYEQYLKPRWLVILTIEPLITLLLLWTDPLHGIFSGGQQSTNAILNGGFWFWFNAVYSFCLLIIANVILIKYMQQAPKISRQQTRTIIFGFLIPIVGTFIGIAHISPFHE
ncbi:MAG TPA: histidine kinase N-terminal 7TM domain-containing protein, partial [Leptolinea sp.]